MSSVRRTGPDLAGFGGGDMGRQIQEWSGLYEVGKVRKQTRREPSERSTVPLTPRLCVSSDQQKREVINLYCFKPPSLWRFFLQQQQKTADIFRNLFIETIR